MVWADGHADDNETDRIIHILARRFRVDDDVKKQIDSFSSVDKKEIKRMANRLCKNKTISM